MDDFKDSTKTRYECGGPVKGTKGAAMVSKTMREFKGKPPIKKARGGAVSSRPVDSSGRRASDFDLGLSSDAAAVEAGNRMPYERMPRDEVAKQTPRRRSVTVERATVSAEPDTRTALDRRLSEKPRRGPAGAGFGVEPLIERARSALGFKRGGLAAVPRK